MLNQRTNDQTVAPGLNFVYLFKTEGDRKVIRQLVSLYNQGMDTLLPIYLVRMCHPKFSFVLYVKTTDWNATLPEGVSPIDVAALIKCYLASLPEPLATFDLYHEIRDARSSIRDMRSILKKLPNVNYMTLEFVTALLLRVSQKSSLNKVVSAICLSWFVRLYYIERYSYFGCGLFCAQV